MVSTIPKIIDIGVIGESPGNGHPISWSAIINGFKLQQIKKLGYSAIFSYLSKHRHWKGIDHAVCSKIYTPDLDRSHKIADACHIKYVCADMDEVFIGSDLILDLTDNPYNRKSLEIFNRHKHAKSHLFIDKPMYLGKIMPPGLLLSSHQICSCSALIYDPDLDLKSWLMNPDLTRVKFEIGNRWDKYGNHLIDPLIQAISDLEYKFNVISSKVNINSKIESHKTISISLERNLLSEIKLDIIIKGYAAPVQITAYSADGQVYSSYQHRDTFVTFKNCIQALVSWTNDKYNSYKPPYSLRNTLLSQLVLNS